MFLSLWAKYYKAAACTLQITNYIHSGQTMGASRGSHLFILCVYGVLLHLFAHSSVLLDANVHVHAQPREEIVYCLMNLFSLTRTYCRWMLVIDVPH